MCARFRVLALDSVMWWSVGGILQLEDDWALRWSGKIVREEKECTLRDWELWSDKLAGHTAITQPVRPLSVWSSDRALRWCSFVLWVARSTYRRRGGRMIDYLYLGSLSGACNSEETIIELNLIISALSRKINAARSMLIKGYNGGHRKEVIRQSRTGGEQ